MKTRDGWEGAPEIGECSQEGWEETGVLMELKARYMSRINPDKTTHFGPHGNRARRQLDLDRLTTRARSNEMQRMRRSIPLLPSSVIPFGKTVATLAQRMLDAMALGWTP